ncbi:hypothetical protein THRCLA_04615 [Thraustotheca clavata]|uniref:Uncharacterized protein n=1 Tax=Thraustotheca clavata TaxID=74557 RepID=A0A1V9ZYN4_9STRA|nr:hypothetical protein THRCLA_04615 [Thraustotheca clavata]
MTELVTIPVGDSSIELECNWDVGIGGSLWTSGRLLVDYLSRNGVVRQEIEGTRVLELGSGTGLVGLAVALFGPASVVLTDLETHVAALENNVKRNAGRIPSRTNVTVEALDWNAPKNVGDGVFEWIVGTDIAYSRSFYVPLLNTLTLFGTKKTKIQLGLGRDDTEMQFFKMLQDAGFEYYKISEAFVASEFHGKDFGLFEIRRVYE